MLPQKTVRIAIIPCNTILHAETVAKYSPFCQISKHYIPANLAVFLGFNAGMDMVAQHFKNKGVPTLCWWIGTDIMNYSQDPKCPTCAQTVPRPISPTNLYDYHWCPTEANKLELEKVGIKATVQPVVQATAYPLVKKFSKQKRVLLYSPLGRTDQPLDWEVFRNQMQSIYMLDKCSNIIEQCPDIQFTLYGNYSPVLNTPKNVRSLGFIPKEEMSKLYADHNIYMRWTEHEGFAQSCIEAKQSGLYVITNQKNPHMIFADSVESFVKQLKSLKIKEPDKKGSEYYQSNFKCSDVVEKWGKILRLDLQHDIQADYSGEIGDLYGGLAQ